MHSRPSTSIPRRRPPSHPPTAKSVSFMRYAICRSLRRPWPAARTMTACERDKSLTLIHVVHKSIHFLLLPLPLLLPRWGLKWQEAWVRQRCGNTEAQRPTIISHQRCLSTYYCNSEGHRSIKAPMVYHSALRMHLLASLLPVQPCLSPSRH